jgi:hypothetical protein
MAPDMVNNLAANLSSAEPIVVGAEPFQFDGVLAEYGKV